ncbi:hypothetical protein EX30DRAFT_347138 [Ascodesmis nigricans]|uniref:Mitochondrial F1F0-ATP synthase g subunit n=1 Tax=Ascodesmis nigricans TaxID=341454 RepID=A0A4S2N0W1_9PEZI|nr:hypothetical protein EX30DRAFT_347138 [Ascodesmis nigricans]
MRPSVLRIAARRPFHFSNRRLASSTAENAQNAAKEQAAKAQQAAKESAVKAQAAAKEGAAKAQAAAAQFAGKAMAILGKSGESFAKLAAKSTGRTGQLLKSIERAIPPTIYYSKVAIELSKLVFRGQKMSPPDLATFQSTLKTLFNPQNIAAYSRNAVQVARTASRKEAAQVGVIVAEVIGFFTIGEILGRRKLIGYRGKVEHH